MLLARPLLKQPSQQPKKKRKKQPRLSPPQRFSFRQPFLRTPRADAEGRAGLHPVPAERTVGAATADGHDRSVVALPGHLAIRARPAELGPRLAVLLRLVGDLRTIREARGGTEVAVPEPWIS